MRELTPRVVPQGAETTGGTCVLWPGWGVALAPRRSRIMMSAKLETAPAPLHVPDKCPLTQALPSQAACCRPWRTQGWTGRGSCGWSVGGSSVPACARGQKGFCAGGQLRVEWPRDSWCRSASFQDTLHFSPPDKSESHPFLQRCWLEASQGPLPNTFQQSLCLQEPPLAEWHQ